MPIDRDKIDEMVLALLHLTTFKDGLSMRSWKGYDWDTMDRLHEKGFISNPRSKSKSVVLSDEAVERSRELFEELFGLHQGDQ